MSDDRSVLELAKFSSGPVRHDLAKAIWQSVLVSFQQNKYKRKRKMLRLKSLEVQGGEVLSVA